MTYFDDDRERGGQLAVRHRNRADDPRWLKHIGLKPEVGDSITAEFGNVSIVRHGDKPFEVGMFVTLAEGAAGLGLGVFSLPVAPAFGAFAIVFTGGLLVWQNLRSAEFERSQERGENHAPPAFPEARAGDYRMSAERRAAESRQEQEDEPLQPSRRTVAVEVVSYGSEPEEAYQAQRPPRRTKGADREQRESAARAAGYSSIEDAASDSRAQFGGFDDSRPKQAQPTRKVGLGPMARWQGAGSVADARQTADTLLDAGNLVVVASAGRGWDNDVMALDFDDSNEVEKVLGGEMGKITVVVPSWAAIEGSDMAEYLQGGHKIARCVGVIIFGDSPPLKGFDRDGIPARDLMG